MALPVSQEIHELLAGLCLVECTAKIGCCGNGILLLHATHLHAHMLGLNNNHHTQRIQRLLDTLLYLQCQSFLHLQAARKDLHHTGNLTQSRNIAIGDICHMHFAKEWQNMVFAQRIEINILDYHHLTVIFLEHCCTQNSLGGFIITGRGGALRVTRCTV